MAVEQHACKRRRAEHGAFCRSYLRLASLIIARLAERRQPAQGVGHTHPFLDCRLRVVVLDAGVLDPDKEHALSGLRDAVIGTVQHLKVGFVANLFRLLADVGNSSSPAFVLGECLDVLHHERLGLDPLDHAEEVEDVTRAGVVRVHLPRDREALTGRSSND